MKKIKIIAEIGNTHEGSVGLAKQFISTAAACGVDAVKFQTHIFDAESLPNAPSPPYFKEETRKAYFERTSFAPDQYRVLIKFAEQDCGVEFISSPFSIEAAAMLLDLGLTTLKIPSGEVSNLPLLEFIARSRCSVLLSSGMSSWAELDRAYDVLKDCNLTILQCTSAYPCKPEDAGLNLIPEIKIRYQTPVGFSDHTTGIAVPVAAAALGCTVIEKHFTLSKYMYGSDAKHSMEPAAFKLLCEAIRDTEAALNSNSDKDAIVDSLWEMKNIFEKSIVAAQKISRGTRLQESHFAYKKPGIGIRAAEYRDLLGMFANHDFEPNEYITWEGISEKPTEQN